MRLRSRRNKVDKGLMTRRSKPCHKADRVESQTWGKESEVLLNVLMKLQ
jgi:hypothetical protein